MIITKISPNVYSIRNLLEMADLFKTQLLLREFREDEQWPNRHVKHVRQYEYKQSILEHVRRHVENLMSPDAIQSEFTLRRDYPGYHEEPYLDVKPIRSSLTAWFGPTSADNFIQWEENGFNHRYAAQENHAILVLRSDRVAIQSNDVGDNQEYRGTMSIKWQLTE